MTKTINCLLLITALLTMITVGCKKDNPVPVAPSLTTAGIINIGVNSATSGGTITSSGSAAITASGICWSSINNTPTIVSDSNTVGTTSSGSFISVITNLVQNTTYYIRAYATNSAGTGYGNVISFSTSVDTTKVTFTYNGQTVTYGIIISPTTGRKWMDRNLGASEAGTSPTDTLAYGDLFEWGRLADGHQLRSSDTTGVLSVSDVPGHGKFIIAYNAPFDWRNPPNNNLWQGTTGNNNPCPSGWHVPANAELEAEIGITNNSTGYSQLKFVIGGYRVGDGTFSGVGVYAVYWTSTSETDTGPTADHAYWWYTDATTVNTFDNGGAGVIQKAVGVSVRCIKN